MRYGYDDERPQTIKRTMAAYSNFSNGLLMTDIDNPAYATQYLDPSPHIPPNTAQENAIPSTADLMRIIVDMQERHHREMQQLHQQQMAFQQQQLHLEQQKLLQASSKLPEFRIPSVSPPTFKGEPRKKARDTQAAITNYLDEAERLCRSHNLRGDGQPARYNNHLTYVQWLEAGLKEHAAERWRKLDFNQRVNMTFHDFKNWVQLTFSSPLSFHDAMRSLTTLKQHRSCREYVEEFDHLVRAIKACNIKLQEEVLVFFFREGLKDHLQQSKDLFEIKILRDLQTEATRLDTFYWETQNSLDDHLDRIKWIQERPDGRLERRKQA
ncbi:hypothetical protein HDU96_005119 [Phlyctochytrium bullatum]|nr:hypothetical protein HDU96_005119 [Phlyctochytrium bullatum]